MGAWNLITESLGPKLLGNRPCGVMNVFMTGSSFPLPRGPELVSLLLDHGGDPDLLDQSGFSALHWAAINGRTESVYTVSVMRFQSDPRRRSGPSDLDLESLRKEVFL